MWCVDGPSLVTTTTGFASRERSGEEITLRSRALRDERNANALQRMQGRSASVPPGVRSTVLAHQSTCGKEHEYLEFALRDQRGTEMSGRILTAGNIQQGAHVSHRRGEGQLICEHSNIVAHGQHLGRREKASLAVPRRRIKIQEWRVCSCLP